MIGVSSWDEYHEASDDDNPIAEIVELVNALSRAGHEIWGFTARPEKFRQLTMNWMVNNGVNLHDILMRGDEDFRKSEEIKMDMIKDRISEVSMIIDDDEEVCKVFTGMGITTMRVIVRGNVK